MALVAAWNFNEQSGNAIDVTGKGNLATLASGTRGGAQAGFGRSVSLNGTSDNLTVAAANNDLGNTVGPMTVSAWILPSTTAAQLTIFDTTESPSSSLGFAFYIVTDNRIQFTTKGVHDYGNGVDVTLLGAWHHIAAVLDSGFDVQFYLDGATTGSLQTHTVNGNANTTQGWIIGASANNTTDPTRFWFKGLIDDLRIYNHAQTLAEIQYDMIHPLDIPRADFSRFPKPAMRQPLSAGRLR